MSFFFFKQKTAYEILAGHAEARRGHLLDGAAARVAVGIATIAHGVLAALAGVRLAAEAIHGDGERLVGLLADGAVRHRACGEALQDGCDRLVLSERKRRGSRLALAHVAAARR